MRRRFWSLCSRKMLDPLIAVSMLLLALTFREKIAKWMTAIMFIVYLILCQTACSKERLDIVCIPFLSQMSVKEPVIVNVLHSIKELVKYFLYGGIMVYSRLLCNTYILTISSHSPPPERSRIIVEIRKISE